MIKKKKKIKCEIKKCNKIATKKMDHFTLTGEYSTQKLHNFCESHYNGSLALKEMTRQMHELASEDEQISGDYES